MQLLLVVVVIRRCRHWHVSVETTILELRRPFAGERVDQHGHAFSFQNANLDYARPDIDVIVAGRGPRMTALGGQLADGFNFSYIRKDLLGAHARSLRQACGNRRFQITYSTMIAITDEEHEAARAQVTFRLVDSPDDDVETHPIRSLP